jgi:hypothetical protein
MDYPDDEITRLLQVLCTVAVYRTITRPNTPDGELFDRFKANNDYWRCIPYYLISRCPICQRAYKTKIDTYSLENCPRFISSGGWFSSNEYAATPLCAHYVGMHLFTHLNQNEPRELKYSRSFDSAEVPSVQLNLMSNDIVSYATLHALPVCRIEDEKFVPRYTLYFMLYFSEDPGEIDRRWIQKEQKFFEGDDEAYGHSALMVNPQEPEAEDLLLWVRRGRLKWLDLDQPDLPLRDGPPEAFPYANIHGRRKGFVYAKGAFYDLLL